MTADEIRALFKMHETPLSQNDVWAVQGNPVIKHKALERLAANLNIRFDPPEMLRKERDEAVILVTGHLGENSEWSIGEALVNANYRVSGKMAPYVYAMAEKRAKDRVILKLAGLFGAYSEDEADEFKDKAPQPTQDSRGEEDAIALFRQQCDDTLRSITTTAGLETYWNGIQADIPASERQAIIADFAARKAEIEAITKD